MIRILTIIFLVLTSTHSHGQDIIYTAAGVPAGLKKNAHSVKWDELIEFEVRSVDKAFYNVHRVITILDEAGKDELQFVKFTDQFHSLEKVSIEVLDGLGNRIKKYERSDLAKQANTSELVPNGKYYFLDIPAVSFPATIKMDYGIKYNGILNYPDYDIQLPYQSVERSVFTAKVPVDLDLRFKELNTKLPVVITSEGKYKLYTWAVNNLPAIEEEAGSAEGNNNYPKILLSPNKFELDGYAGDMSSWKNFGNWYGTLSKNSGNLSAERKEFFRALVRSANTDEEKIKLVYNYLQNNFRYVSIQLGIGGFKPFDADFVDRKKYGDCKALSNYMQAALAAVDIKSHQALVSRYYVEPIEPDFPYNGFNHCIVCVPREKDSIWLECTSTTNEMGVLGSSTENRNALLITEDGGRLVATPRSRSSENTFSSNSTVVLHEEGSGTANVSLHTTGEYRQHFIRYILNETKDEQKKFIVNSLGFIQPDEFEIDHDKKKMDAGTKLVMKLEKIPEFTAGSKMFLNPRIYKLWSYAMPKAENRTQDFYFDHPFIKTDSTVYILPAGFVPETLPKARNVKFEYGSFYTTYAYNEKQRSIITTAKLVLNEYRIPVAKFPEARKFFNDVLEEYTEKIVIKRQ